MKGLFKAIDSLVNKLVKNYTLMIVLGLVVLAVIAINVYSGVFPALLQPAVYGSYTLAQPEWSNDRRERYYQTSQGSLVAPYAWYRALELRTGTEMYASPEVQVRYGLLFDNDPKYNPDRLPVGIVKDIVRDEYADTLGEGHKEWVSLSCAACHTGQLSYKGTAIRIDGGQSSWSFEQWSADLVFSLMLTSASPSKFERFCARVFRHGESGTCSDSEKKTLRAQLNRYFSSPLIMDAVNAIINRTYATKEGFMRTAALGRGVNGEFGLLDGRNIVRNSGPVSYPPLWYTHDFDWVQSVAAIRQPLGRNVTEAWGVNVRVELKNPAELFASTAKVPDMFWMETLLSILQAPNWPEAILGPINQERAERGRRLYHEAVWDKALPAASAELPENAKELILGPNPNRPTTGYCARCHAPALEAKPDALGRRYLQLPLYRMEVMGTDPDDAVQFRARQVHTGNLEASVFDNQNVVGIGVALGKTISGILDRWFDEHKVSESCRTLMEGYRPNLFRAPPGYPARPLDGYWATGPFLHNGSVRTIYELLGPVEERAKSFWLGSREFDPVHLGFRDEKVEGAFLFDTSLAGNTRAGHEFRDAPANTPGVIGPRLSHEQRLDIIEYMKVLDSVQIDRDALMVREALLNAMAPYYEKFTPLNPALGIKAAVPFGTPEKEGGWKMTTFCEDIAKAIPVQKAHYR